MDIRINAKGHGNQEKMDDFYKKRISDKLKKYIFVKVVDVDVVQNSDRECQVGISVLQERGNKIYASSSDAIEHIAFVDALKKIKRQLERYKEIHYKSSHKNTTS